MSAQQVATALGLAALAALLLGVGLPAVPPGPVPEIELVTVDDPPGVAPPARLDPPGTFAPDGDSPDDSPGGDDSPDDSPDTPDGGPGDGPDDSPDDYGGDD